MMRPVVVKNKLFGRLRVTNYIFMTPSRPVKLTG